MAKLYKISTCAIKSENTQGSAATMIATDYLQVMDVQVKPVMEQLERDFTRNSFDTVPSVVGSSHYEVSFKTELKWTGSAALVYQPLDALFKACGFTVSSSTTDHTYTPTSSPSSSAMNGPWKSATVEVVRDGYKRQIVGVVGSFKLNMEAGQIPMLEFTGKGKYAAATDVATMPLITGSNQILPPLVESVSLTVSGSTNLIPAKFEMDMGNNVVKIDDVGSVDGVYGFAITGRKPVGSFDPLATTVATNDFLAAVYNSTQFSVNATIGSTAGNRCQITAPAVQYTDIQDTARNDLFAFQLPLRFNGSGTYDNCVSFRFY